MMLETASLFWKPESYFQPLIAPFAIQSDSDQLTGVICTGSETGWEISPHVAAAVAEHMTQILHNSTDDPSQTFVQAAVSARQFILDHFEYADDAVPGATALGCVIRDNQAWISWLGSELAWHFRTQHLIAETTPHTMGNFARAAGHDPLGLPEGMSTIPMRLISSSHEVHPDAIDTLKAPWTLISGDTLILTTIYLAEQIDPHQVAQQLEGKSATEIADDLMAALSPERKSFGAAAIVIRIL